MRKKNVSKEQVPRAKNIGERIFVDISSIKHISAGEAKFWHLIWKSKVYDDRHRDQGRSETKTMG